MFLISDIAHQHGPASAVVQASVAGGGELVVRDGGSVVHDGRASRTAETDIFNI